jgi:hypothetical protein
MALVPNLTPRDIPDDITRKKLNELIDTINMSDLNLEIPAGNIAGKTSVNKFGRNSAVASGATEDIWDGSNIYTWPATALMTKLSQTTDQAAMRGETVEVQGLAAGFVATTQDVTLNASDTTTPVTLTTPLLRAFRMKVQADVVTTSPIRLHNDAESVDYAIIGTGNNQTLMALYTVAAGKTAYVTNYYGTANAGGGAPTTLNVRLWAKDNANSYERQLKHVMGVSGDVDAYGRFQHFFRPYARFNEKTDIYIDATTVGAAADVSAGFDLILVNN